ncbi:MAG: hypothetical protein WA432_00655 [Candidatus Babeliaceae bacterium]
MTMKFDGTPCCKLYEDELKHNHCCDMMTECTHDSRVPLNYQPQFRRYIVSLTGPNADFRQILFCPWCDTKLPESLEDTYYEILDKEYGLTQGLDIQNDRRIPQEFKSDEWWKKRGL